MWTIRSGEIRETLLRVHLIPAFGARRLDEISSEDVARLKSRLVAKAPKTVTRLHSNTTDSDARPMLRASRRC